MPMDKPVRHLKLLIGIPGVGKSTYLQDNAEEFEDYTIISLDHIAQKWQDGRSGVSHLATRDDALREGRDEICKEFDDMLQQAVDSGDNILIDRSNDTRGH